MGAKFGLLLTEEHKLRMFEAGYVRIIFGPKRKDVTASESVLLGRTNRKEKNENTRRVALMGEMRNANRVLVENMY
jgi:hypothetical protein